MIEINETYEYKTRPTIVVQQYTPASEGYAGVIVGINQVGAQIVVTERQFNEIYGDKL